MLPSCAVAVDGVTRVLRMRFFFFLLMRCCGSAVAGGGAKPMERGGNDSS